LEKSAKELKSQLKEKSYPAAVFGSKKLFHKMLIAEGQRHNILKREWIDRRSNHFFSVGQANQRGNVNTGLLHKGDFSVLLHVPGH
jgi:hypothetical protein